MKHTKVLLVETDPEQGRSLQDMLAQVPEPGLDLECASDLDVALERLSRGDIDAVLVDLRLVDSVGPDGIAKIHAAAQALPLLVLTEVEDESRRRILPTGTYDYLPKDVMTGPILAFHIGQAIERYKVRAGVLRIDKRFRALIENSSDGVLLLDAAANIQYMSPATHRLMGYAEDEAAGISGFDFLHPEDVGRITELYNKVSATPSVPLSAEMRIRHKDRSWHHIEVVATNHLDDLAVGAIVINMRDITERKQAEEALREAEKRYRAVLNNPLNMIWISREDGVMLEASEAAMKFLELTQEDMGVINLVSLIHPEDLLTALPAMAAAINEGHCAKSVELRVISKSGRVAWVELHGCEMEVRGGCHLGLGIAHDITERKAMEKELAALNHNLEKKVRERTIEVEKLLAQKDAFINQLGHDLKSPLTPLVTLLPILREDVQVQEQQEMVDIAIQNVDFIKELVNKTLKLARLSTIDNGPSTARTSMKEQLDAVLKGRKLVADEKGITIETMVEGDIIVQLERLDLQELLDDLLVNAIKYTPEGGRITIDAVLSGPLVTVLVRDTGIGMNAEQLSHLFEEFYKADPSRHDLDSSGLGLSICKRIVERAGGKIWAESEGLGKGSTFYFTLPLSCVNSGTEGKFEFNDQKAMVRPSAIVALAAEPQAQGSLADSSADSSGRSKGGR